MVVLAADVGGAPYVKKWHKSKCETNGIGSLRRVRHVGTTNDSYPIVLHRFYCFCQPAKEG